MSTPVNSVYGRGTPGYRAPELLATDKSTSSNRCDIWALVCVIHQLTTGRRIFSNDVEVAMDVNAPPDPPLEVLSESEFLQHHISEFLRDLLNKDAALRPNTDDASHLMLGYFHLSDFSDISDLLPAREPPLSYLQHKDIARHFDVYDRLEFLFQIVNPPL
jgi:serine/threonine protein kinase